MSKEYSNGVAANVRDCDIIASEFDYLSINFRKGMNTLILPAIDWIVTLLCKDGSGIKWPMKVYMPLNKVSKSEMEPGMFDKCS